MSKEPGKSDPAAQLGKAVERFRQGDFEEAARRCKAVLAAAPDNVEALNVLGACLVREGKIAEAARIAERVCSMSPGNPVFLANLGYLYSLLGNFPQAVLAMARAVICDPENRANRDKFARLIDHMAFYRLAPETADIRNAIRICLDAPRVDALPFSTAWHTLLLLDPAFARLAEVSSKGDFEQQATNLDARELETTLADPFLLLGMRSLHASDARLERILTFLRRWFLMQFDRCQPEAFLPFLCALAEHCMLNEYVYCCTEQELQALDALESQLDPHAESGARIRPGIALLLCYRETPRFDDLADALPGQEEDAFQHLLESRVPIAALTAKYRDAIPALRPASGETGNAVSAAVTRQYEENPYPRWHHLDIPALSEDQRARGRGKSILVAGCGTGYEALNLAVHYPEARVLGLDLSLPSLAWGKHRADEYGVQNVEFLQADILELGGLDRTFDLVSSMGVLHHMEDPLAGWRQLLECLAPDGVMKIGLYSETARRSVAACRQWVKEKGIEATADGIRAFRQAVLGLEESDPLREITTWTDFWSMSMCRDLVFHVQEHNVTLPWIRKAVDGLGLRFLRMRIGNPELRNAYRTGNPGDPNTADLEKLHEFEQRNPETFRDMYQFWCCRAGSDTARRPPSWYYTLG